MKKTVLIQILFCLMFGIDCKAGQTDFIFINGFETELGLTCTLTISPGDLFTDAFTQLSTGETLCLNDGRYV